MPSLNCSDVGKDITLLFESQQFFFINLHFLSVYAGFRGNIFFFELAK